MAPNTVNREVNNMVTFMSWNSTGFNTVKSEWFNDILNEKNVMFCSTQEHFKTAQNGDKFFKANFRNFSRYVVPAVRPIGQDSGRASGGLAQLTRDVVGVKKERVKTQNYRLQAQILNLPGGRLLWLNTYFPTDPQLVGYYDDAELQVVLAELELILARGDYTDIVWGSDLNWDMKRNTYFANRVKEFVARHCLVSVWEQHPVEFTHVHTDSKSFSTLDHFMISPRLLPLVESCGAVHRGDNFSRHSPIWLTLNLGALPPRARVCRSAPRRPAWSRATEVEIDNFTTDMQARLENISQPETLNCQDPLCSDTKHSENRDSFMLDILMNLVESSYTTLPMVGGRQGSGAGVRGSRGGLPGWQEEAEPFRQVSLYWYNIWLREGRPSQGWLHSTMVRKRTQYHYAVRRLRRRADHVRAEKLFEASMLGDVNLLKEMRNIKRGRGVYEELQDSVEGATGEEEIVDKFREVYSTLYSSSESREGMEILKQQVQCLIGPESIREVSKITCQAVKKAALLLKPKKSDVSGGFTSDAILNSPDILFVHLAAVFRDWVVHGTVTPSLLACAFLPLLKNSLKDPADTGSYRAIAGSSLILKLFEKTVLLLWGDSLSSDTLQFGFKSGVSTTQCSWLVQEVVGHFLREGSHPLVVVLDCSKAFDLCRFDKLFGSVLEKGMPPIIVRVLMYMYEEQFAWVRWGNARSARFLISNGTRQGSIASPCLWSVYLDPLLKYLRKLGVGCHVGDVFLGVMAYADDLVLLAPNRAAAAQMIDACESWAKENNVLFSTDPNPSKSKSKVIFMCGQQRQLSKPAPLRLCGRDLPFVETATHLGHELHETGTMDYDTRVKKAQFISNSLEIREVFNFASPAEILVAIKVYSCSFYGSNLWELGGNMSQQVFNAWGTAIRLAWNVPRATRSYLVDHVLSPGLTSVRTDIFSKFIGFFRGLTLSPCPEVAFMAFLVGRDLRTTTGRNLRLIGEESGLDPWVCSSKEVKKVLSENTAEVPDVDAWRVSYLGLLLEQRQAAQYSGLEDEESRLNDLISSLCIN